MLETSSERLARLSPTLRTIAEHMAIATMVSALVEDLIPDDEAVSLAHEHRVGATEEWHRAVNAAVAALLALHTMGYALTSLASTSPDVSPV